MHLTAFPYRGTLWNYTLTGACQQKKSSPNSRTFSGGHFNPFLGHLPQPSQGPRLLSRFSTRPPPRGCQVDRAFFRPWHSHSGPPAQVFSGGTCCKGAAEDLGCRTRARAHARTLTHTHSPGYPHPRTPSHTLTPSKVRPGPPDGGGGVSSPLEKRAARLMSTGDQWCHSVPISDAHIPETRRADPRLPGAVWAMKTRSPSSPRVGVGREGDGAPG